MGGGKEKKKTNKMIEQQQKEISEEKGEFKEDLSERLNQSGEQAQESRESLQSGLSAISGRDYSVNPSQWMVTGNYDVDPEKYRVSADFGESRAGYRNFVGSGGVDENRMRLAHPIYQDVATNPDIANRYRGGGVYEEFAKTGGLSEADKGNIRARGTSTIPAYYQRLKEEGQRAQRLQGGYGPGPGAVQSRLARQQAAAGQEAALNTELGIQQQIREGRMFGAQGMTGAEGAYQGARLGAAGGLDTSEANIQNALQRGKMFGVGGLESLTAREAAIEAANADRLSGLEVGNVSRRMGVDIGNMDRGAGLSVGNANRSFGRDQFVSGSLQDLYGSDIGQTRDYLGMNLANRGLAYDAYGNLINQRMQNNPQRDYLGMALGAAGPIISGLTGFR